MFILPTREGTKLFENKEDADLWMMKGTNRWKVSGKLEEIEGIPPMDQEDIDAFDAEMEDGQPALSFFTVYAGVDEDGNVFMSEDEDEVLENTLYGATNKYTITVRG